MSTKQRSSVGAGVVQQAANARKGLTAPAAKENVITTAISLPPHTYDLLRTVALKRASHGHTRFSVSAVIRDLVEENRSKLESES